MMSVKDQANALNNSATRPNAKENATHLLVKFLAPLTKKNTTLIFFLLEPMRMKEGTLS